MTTFAFRICPADDCLIEWRRNEMGAEWMYWCRHITPEAAAASLLGIEQIGYVIERREAIGLANVLGGGI